MDRIYIRNRYCPCARCKASDLMGPVMMITAGILMLLAMYDIREWHSTWPVFLIVVGGMMLLRSSASIEGHRNPGEGAAGEVVPPPASSGDQGVTNG